MNTIIKKVELPNGGKEILEAAEILQKGGLVAFPTETVYGLGADGLREEAARKIYEAKGRPSDNPLIIHIADRRDLGDLAEEIPEKAVKLAKKFWPGPLTMILKKSSHVPEGTTGGLDTVAVRMPSHPLALKLLKVSGIYIAAPSANTSGRPSPTCAEHVKADLDGKIDMILDGGRVEIGIESTIVDVTEKIPVILRPGFITKKMLEKEIGEVVYDPAVLLERPDPNLVPKAPGMKYRHYAPKADLRIVEGETEQVIAYILENTQKKTAQGYKVGILAAEETKDRYFSGIVKTIGSRKDEHSILQGLYGVLRDFDGMGVDYIYSESFQEGEHGYAVMNRLLKAAGYQRERV